MFEYTMKMFDEDVEKLATAIANNASISVIFGIPQGGVPLAIALSGWLDCPIIEESALSEYPVEEVLIVDDLIDSGKTIEKFLDYQVAILGTKPNSPKLPPVCFTARTFPQEWINFWWEPESKIDGQSIITRLLEYIGEDPNREGLKETPARVIRSFDRLYGGYTQDPEKIMKTFEEDNCDEMVILKDITLHSVCEHHMLPFTGVAHIGYIPNGKVLGVSKLARLLDIFARRLQIQERIGEQVTNALMEHLQPLGAACVIEARHSCMTSRGVEQQTTTMITSSLKGVFKEFPEVRAEFMGLIK